jgi:hypothetical protein
MRKIRINFGTLDLKGVKSQKSKLQMSHLMKSMRSLTIRSWERDAPL